MLKVITVLPHITAILIIDFYDLLKRSNQFKITHKSETLSGPHLISPAGMITILPASLVGKLPPTLPEIADGPLPTLPISLIMPLPTPPAPMVEKLSPTLLEKASGSLPTLPVYYPSSSTLPVLLIGKLTPVHSPRDGDFLHPSCPF